ncbi:MAG TPA: hypothetical protein VN226_00460 [Anaerolineales bacterium]|nr:hypothetical protein [Anaerolineales bacterium]
MNLIKSIQTWLVPDLSTPRGNYHATMFTETDRPYKLFLMVNGQGLGTLVINASTVVNLNQTSTDLIYHYIRGTDFDNTIQFMRKKYKQPENSMAKDYEELIDQIEAFLDVNDQAPRSELNKNEDYAGGNDDQMAWLLVDSVVEEPTTQVDIWKAKLDQAVQDGYPHIMLVGSDILKHVWIEKFVRYSEEIGVIVGISTRVVDEDRPLLEKLISEGLDHLSVWIEKSEAVIDPILPWLVSKDLFVEAYLSKELQENELDKVLRNLGSLSIKNISWDPNINPGSVQTIRMILARDKGSVKLSSYSIPNKTELNNADRYQRSEIGNVFLQDGSRWIKPLVN